MNLPPITFGKIIKIIILCLVVGFIMTVVGIGPDTVWHWVITLAEKSLELARSLLSNGLEYILVGAAVVIPVYLIIYLTRLMRDRR